MARDHFLPLALAALTASIFIWSAIDPYSRGTWYMEVAPVIIGLPILAATYKHFRLTNVLYVLIFLHMVVLMAGGHYTYARVPLFDLVRDWGGGNRNDFDKLGHFAQGFVPAIIGRELLIRTSPLRPGMWMSVILVFSCLGISALYELIEWAAAMILGQGADEFLGTQGDPWDTQKDMAYAGIGAVLALLTLSRWHNRALARLLPSSPPDTPEAQQTR